MVVWCKNEYAAKAVNKSKLNGGLKSYFLSSYKPLPMGIIGILLSIYVLPLKNRNYLTDDLKTISRMLQ